MKLSTNSHISKIIYSYNYYEKYVLYICPLPTQHPYTLHASRKLIDDIRNEFLAYFSTE